MTLAVRTPMRAGVPAARVGIVAAEDRHIAAAAAGLVEKAAGRGAGLKRRDHFQQDGVDRQQRVLQTIFGDVAVAVTDAQAHDPGDIADHRLEMRRDQTDLPQPQSTSRSPRYDQWPWKTGLRFSTNALAASL